MLLCSLPKYFPFNSITFSYILAKLFPVFVLCLFMFTRALLLILGVGKEKSALTLPYLISEAIFFVISAVATVVNDLLFAIFVSVTGGLYLFLFALPFLLLNAYFLWVVYSQYMDLKDGEAGQIYIQTGPSAPPITSV